MKEKRRHTRVSVNRPIAITLTDGSTITARIINLSVGGVGIIYAAPAESGSVLEVSFNLPYNGKVYPLKLKATVVHSHLTNDEYYTGFEFVNIDEESRQLLEGYVRGLVKKRVF